MSTSDSLELGAVRKRFTDSADTLEQLRERLQAIALAEDTSTAAATALDSAALKLGETATNLGVLTEELTTATRALEGALGAAAQFLEQTDLAALRNELESIRVAVLGGDKRLAEQLANLGARVGDVAAAHAATSEAENRANAAEARAVESEAALAALKAAIPERTAKKMGIQ